MSTTGSRSATGDAKPSALDTSQTRSTEYNPLHDPDMRRFLQAPQTQKALLSAGLLTEDGRILNFESAGMKSRLKIVEQEFVSIDAEEESLRREEEAVRARVRALRIQQLEEERRAKLVAIRQEQTAIRDEVSRLTKVLTGGGGPLTSPGAASATRHQATGIAPTAFRASSSLKAPLTLPAGARKLAPPVAGNPRR